MDPQFIHAIYRIVRDVEADVGLDDVSPRARALLKLIGEENTLGAVPRAADVIAQSGLGTPPTIYASLVELENGGWIERRKDEDDARASRIYLTAQAKRAFARMSRLVEKKLRSSD